MRPLHLLIESLGAQGGRAVVTGLGATRWSRSRVRGARTRIRRSGPPVHIPWTDRLGEQMPDDWQQLKNLERRQLASPKASRS